MSALLKEIVGGVEISIDLPQIASVEYPFRHVRQGRAVRLVVGDTDLTTDASRQAILKAIARARRWYEQITTGKSSNITQLAGIDSASPRFIRMQMKLVQLSPQSIENIVTRPESLPLSLGDLLAIDSNGLAQAVSRTVGKVSITSTPIPQLTNYSGSYLAAWALSKQPLLPLVQIMQSSKSQLSPVPLSIERELPKLPSVKCRRIGIYGFRRRASPIPLRLGILRNCRETNGAGGSHLISC